LGDLVGVTLLLNRMLEKFLTDGLGMNTAGHEVVTSIAKDTDDLGRQCLVQDSHCGLKIRLIALCDGTLLDMLASAQPECFNVGKELILHHRLLFSGMFGC
jgi:hypothetical protein